MDWSTLLAFCVGLVLLVLGAEWLVRGASRLAAAAGVSPLVVGLTVVAFGTSAPELAVSIKAAWAGQADMSVGNVVGSNIFNVLLIVGLSAAITPLFVAAQLVRRDVPVMIGTSLVLIALAADGAITRLDGAVLFGALVLYTLWILRVSRSETKAEAVPAPTGAIPVTGWRRDLCLVLGGCALLVIGSGWLVDGAVAFARWLGLSEVVVGLTIVAAGTSLPELATSVTAALRGERDIAVGNVVGSNVFNIMGVLGISSLVAPDGLSVMPSMRDFDLPVMLAAAFACLPFFARGYLIPRWEGVLFVFYYIAYATYLVLDATKHEAKAGYARVMLQFVVPLTVITLALVALSTRARNSGRRSGA